MQQQHEMKTTIEELTEWKKNAQAMSKLLQKQLEEANQEKKNIERKLETEKKQWESEKAQIQKNFEREKEKLIKEKEALAEEKSELQDSFESVTLDKEFAEERVEELEKEVERLRGQVQIMEAERKTALSGAPVKEFTPEAFEELTLQNEKLKEALMKLRDLSLAEKQEREKKIKELEKENATVISLEEKLLKTEEELLKAEELVEELREELDIASQAEGMIQDLTDKNLTLEETVAQLRTSIQELEELKEMSEELEEHQIEVEKKLRSELYIKDVQLADQESLIANMKTAAIDRENTIEQFRAKVQLLEQKLLEYRAKEQIVQSEAEQLSSQSLALQSQNLQLKAQIVNYEAMSINEQLRKFDATQANRHVSLMKAILPEHFFQSYEDAVLFILLVERIAFKSDLVMKALQQNYQLKAFEETDPNALAAAIAALMREKSTEDEFIFAWQLFGVVAKLRNVVLHVQETLDHCEVAVFLEMGKMRYDVSPIETKLDDILHLMRREELTQAYPVKELVSLYDKVESVITFKMTGASDMPITSFLPSWRALQHEAFDILCQASVMALEELKASRALESYLSGTHHDLKSLGSLLLDAREGITELGNSSRSVIRLVKNREQAEAPPTVQLGFIKKSIIRAKEALSSLLQFFHKLNDDVRELLENASATNKLSVDQIQKALIEIFKGFEVGHHSQEWQSEEQEEDTTAGRTVINVMKGVQSLLSVLSDEIAATSSKAKRVEGKEPPPWKKRADVIKSEVAGAISIRTQLMEEVQEKDRLLTIREYDLSESKRKNKVYEAQLEHLQKREHELDEQLSLINSKFSQNTKMYEDAIASMGKDLSNFEAENVKLRKALAEATKEARSPFRSTAAVLKATTKALESSVAEVPASVEASTIEIQTLRNALKMLREENDRLKKQETARHLEALLPSLPVFSSLNLAKKAQQPSGAEIVTAHQMVSNLIKEVKQVSQLPVVVPLARLHPSTSTTASKPSSIKPLALIPSPSEPLTSKVQSAKEKIGAIIQRHRASLSSSLDETLPSSTPVVAETSSRPPVLIGRLSMPGSSVTRHRKAIGASANAGAGVLLDTPQFEQMHMVFVQ